MNKQLFLCVSVMMSATCAVAMQKSGVVVEKNDLKRSAPININLAASQELAKRAKQKIEEEKRSPNVRPSSGSPLHMYPYKGNLPGQGYLGEEGY